MAVFCLLATRSIAQQAVTFNNAAPVSIADRNGADPGVASPYPSTITVAGLTGVLTDVNVTVNGLTGSASDLALLLVSPNGARMILQANVGSTSEHSNVSYTLDDNAGSALPTTSRIRGDRAYRPTVVSVTGLEPRFPASGPNPPPADCLPKEECASATPYGSATMNSAFGGTNPNGTWRLYAVDMAAGRTVSLAGGWSLTFTTDFIEPTPTPNPNATPRPTPTPGPPGGGQLDPTFDGDGKLVPGPFSGFDAITDIAALTDGKLIVLGLINGSNVLARYLSNGQLDASFGSSGQVALVAAELVVLALQQDGKIVIGGTIGGFGPQDFVLLRRNADGSPDTSFDNDGMVRTDIADTNANTQDNNSLSDLVIQPDGKILAVGSDLARYNSNGSLDATFGTGGTIRGVGGRAVALQGDGKFILNSDFFNSQTDTGTMGVRRYHANGSPDTTFGDNGRASVAFANERDVKSRDVLVQPDGRIVVAGSVTRIRLGFGHEPLDGDYICALARFNADGSIDNTFDADGTQSTDAGGLNEIQRLANGPGGSIIAAGTNHKYSGREDFILMRYTAAGALESGFNAGNVVKTDFFARRDELRGLTLQGDGKIVVAGLVTTPSTGRDFGLVRYLANGTLDSSFGTAGRATHAFPGSFSLTTVVVQPDGKILAGGGAGDCYLVVRYTPGGALDGTFGTGGVVTTAFDDHLGIINGSSDVRLNAAFVHELAVTPDGKIVAGGDNNPGQFDWHLTFARYNTDGSADLTFSGDGQFAQLTNGSLISDSQEGFHDMALNCDGALLHTYSVRFGGGYTSFVAGAGSGSLDEALIRSLAVFPDNGFVVGAQDYNYGTGPLRPGFTIARFTRGGNRDGRFGTNGEVHYDFGGGETAPRSLRVQPDHKTVAYLAASSGLAVLARVNPDGSLDNSFGAGGRVQTDLTSNSPGQVEFGQLEVLADGRLLAAGTIDNNYVIERFFSDGTLDTTFGTSGRAIADFGGSDTVNSIAVQPDGRIVAIGRSGIARFTGASSTADVCAAPTPGPAFCSYAASLSTASIAPGTQLVPESRQFPNLRIALPFAFGFYGQSQNEVTVSWAGTLSFNSEGNSASALNSCLPAPGFDNTIFAYWDDLRLGGAESGIYTAVSGTAPNRVFHIEWRMVTDSGDHPVNFEVRLYEGQQNFDIIYNNSATANGVGATVGVQQGTGTNGAAYSELLCDAGILRPGTKVSYAFGGCAPTPLPQPGCQVGGRDRSFDVDGRVRTDFAAKADEAYAIAHQTDGKIVAAGYATVGSGSDFAVARYNQDGSPDSSFGTNGKVTTDFGTFFDRAYAVAIQADGKIVAAGTTLSNSNDFAIARYHANGTLDTSFGTGGLVRTHFGAGADEAFGVVIQNDGKIVAAGYARVGTGNDFALARYLANGTLDASFDTDGLVTTHFGAGADQAAAVVLQPDGKIVLGGRATVGSSPDFALARYNPNGTLDATFSGDGRATTSLSGWTDIASAIALQPDGKIVAAGSASGDFSIDFALARFNSDGTLDTSFDADGKVTRALTDNDDDALSVAIQADGRIVAAGRARFEGNRFALVRYEANGAPDNSFGVGGVSTTSFGSGNEEARAVAIAADGRIAAAGRGLEPAAGATLDFALVRYESTCPDAPPPPTPTPTPTATPIPTATPVPTITPLPTATPTATATATPTPEPTATPSPSPTPEPQPMQLLNIATRLRVQTGENVLIGGIIVTGTEPKKVIIRAIGPSLSAAFDGALADPVLELYQGDTLLASNDNWRDSQQAEIEATTIPPADDLESAIVYTLDPGFYTGVMSGRAGTTGIGVIEVYDLDQAANSKLANIASRGFVEAGENVMIGGLIVGGNGTLPARVLLRAIGPSLGEAGVAGALPDPFMELRDNNGELLSENDNWQDTQSGEIAATTIPPSHPFESAIVTTLPPGNYTAVVRGKNDTTGVGLVEVYTVR